MRFEGLVIGIAAFLIIGVFHPIIVKCEYYFTDKVWPVFLAVGIVAAAASCFIYQSIVSAVLAIFGCTCLWSVIELREQKERVKKGWFPKNPAHAEKRTAGKNEEHS